MNIIESIENGVSGKNAKPEFFDESGLSYACEADMYYQEVFDAACESTKMSKDARENLPDTAFALVYTDDNGVKKRKYPLIIKHDNELEKDQQQKAIAYFHFVAPKYKKTVAIAIIDAISQTNSGAKISPKSQIHLYAKVPKEMIGNEKSFNTKGDQE